MSRTSQNVCLTLPGPLLKALDLEAQAQDRPRSYVVRKLLERSLSGTERMEALNAVAAEGLREFADAAVVPRALNATEVIASPESCTDGHGRLAALEKIAAGRK
jgi:predicted transcriptional regulator